MIETAIIGFLSGFIGSVIAGKFRGYYNIRKSFKGGFKLGYEQGLNQNEVVCRGLSEVGNGLQGNCFMAVRADYPPAELMK